MRERAMTKSPTIARIRVSGFRPPSVAPGRRDRGRPVPLVRPLNWIGPLGAACILGAVLLRGTPHVLLGTTSTSYGAVRYYEDCAYGGLDGRMVHVRNAECPLFRLLREGR